ncbi:MAG: glycoside hydrolase family 127 protein [Planctomycetota bacterium]
MKKIAIDPQNDNAVRTTNGSPDSPGQAWRGCCISFLTINKIASVLFVLLLLPTALADASEVSLEAALEPVYFQKIKIDGFWKAQFKRLTEKWIPHCIEQMEAGGEGQELLNLVHTAKALKGQPHGEFTGRPWSDAYVYNTVESICLALAVDSAGDEELAKAQKSLRAKMEEWIPIILAAQCDDGYIHSFHVVNKHPRYSNVKWHEFYVQGYFLEMGVAHYRITGGRDRRLYDAAVRCADHLCDTFGPAPKRVWIHGHAGMGYALCRLARLVNEAEGPGEGDKYFELAKFLLDTRHTVEEHRSAYDQSHRPVVEMTDAVGHAVRATYFYTAMADLATLTHDDDYLAAVDGIWHNAVHRKHYITGGVGASHRGEAFSDDFDVRNDGYCESCAGCGLTFWADRMHRIHHDAHHVDVQERTLYNNLLGAVELSGENFFYQNPLVSEKPRYSWHGCPCCVGNIPRALLAIKDLTYALDPAKNTLYVSHFVAGEGTIADIAGTSLCVCQETGYPWTGAVKITLNPREEAEFTLKIRIPDRSESDLYIVTPEVDEEFTVDLNGTAQTLSAKDGYVSLRRTWQSGDVVELTLPMEVQRVRCDERAVANRGRVALIRGPIAYNVENVDHDHDVRKLILPPSAPLKAVWKPELLGGVMTIEGQAAVQTEEGTEPATLLAVPNYVRLNRGGWSQVWITEDPEKTVAVGSQSQPFVKPIVREELDTRTLDRVVIGDAESEKRHNLQGKNTAAGVFRNMRWRHAGNGWFSYDLEVKPDAQNVLLCTYWGSDTGNRRFDLLVDDRKIAHQTLNRDKPGEFFDVEYTIPEELTRSKNRVTVRVQADAGATAGGVFDLRTLGTH